MRGQQILAAVASTVMAFGAQAFAQTSSSSSTSTQQNTTGQITTVTGCLQRADVKAGDRTVGTSGSTTGSEEQFVLLRAHVGKGPGGATGAPDTEAAPAHGGTASGSSERATGNAAGRESGPAYIVLGGNRDELRSQVDHLVEVTGQVEARTTGTSSPSDIPPASGANTGPRVVGHVTAQFVRVIAQTCGM